MKIALYSFICSVLLLASCAKPATKQTPPPATSAVAEAETLYPVKQMGKSAFIDKSGKIVIPAKFDEADRFSDGLAQVMINGQWAYIDQTGNVIIDLKDMPKIDLIHPFSEGMAGIIVDNKFGAIDKTGKLVIKLQFDDAGRFSEGLSAVRSGGKWGYVDTSGHMVINPQFDDADYFSGGLARVAIGGKVGRMLITEVGEIRGKVGYIDKTGKYVWDPSN